VRGGLKALLPNAVLREQCARHPESRTLIATPSIAAA